MYVIYSSIKRVFFASPTNHSLYQRPQFYFTNSQINVQNETYIPLKKTFKKKIDLFSLNELLIMPTKSHGNIKKN